MSVVEDRIVGMKFDNTQFEPAAKTSLSTLDRLKSALTFSGASKGMSDLQNSANRFSLGGLGNAAQGVSGKFLAMSTVGITAIANLTNRAVDAGVKIAKALTIDPAKQGFAEYELKLGSVQTILSNTKASGATLDDVNKTLQELNEYSDKTIYNFGEMAKNIGTFTAAGVDLKTSTESIKGIANLAALSGSNSQQASTAMYQLSQAISAGRVGLQDWNSVVNAGMGGTVFQRALAQTAERMGTLDKGAVKLSGKMKNATINGKSFRESITAKPGQESWLTSGVLTETLKTFTGDMKEADLVAAGFSKETAKAMYDQGILATEAATQVKTFSQLMGTLQESAGSGWAQSMEILVGDFEEAKKLFTEVNNVLGDMIGASAKSRNDMLTEWKTDGGRVAVINGISNAFHALMAIAKPIGEAFREIFPPITGKQLATLSKNFEAFTKQLTPGKEALDVIKRIAKGFFAALSIGVSIVKAVADQIGQLFGYLSNNSGGFLVAAAEVGDWLVKLDEAIKKGDLITGFFEGLKNAIQSPMDTLRNFGGVIADFFENFSVDNPFGGLTNDLGRFGDRLSPLAGIAKRVAGAWEGVVNVFKAVADFLSPAIVAVKTALGGIGDAIAEAFEAGNFSSVYDALNTGLLAGIIVVIKKFMDGGLKIDFGGGLVSGIKDTFGALTDTLSAMQQQIQAKTLLMIAGAVALLTVSIVALSMIDSKKLTKAMIAISVAFGQLLGAMAILNLVAGSAGYIKIPLIAASMVALATAVLILSAAVKVLSTLSWEELAKGLAGVAVLMGILVLASKGLSGASAGMMQAGLAMIPLAIGIRILVGAVWSLAMMSWGELAKGMAGLAVSLGIIAGAMRLMPKNMIGQAAALLLLSVALNAIGTALRIMGGMSVGEIAKSLITLAGSLIIISAALKSMTGALPGSAALIVAAGAIGILAPALLLLSTLSGGNVAQVLITLAGALGIMSIALNSMTKALPGAAALIVAAGALAILVPTLVILGTMPWQALLQGLLGLAAMFAVIGVAALLLTPVIPAILALSASLLVLGVGLAFIGGGLIAVATAFSIFASAGAVGLTTLGGMIALIPQFLIKFAEGVIGFATTIAAQAGKFVGAFASLLGSLLDALIMVMPKIGTLLMKLVQLMVQVLTDNVPTLARAGLNLIVQLLLAISSKIGMITTIVVSIIAKFLQAIANGIPKIARSGANIIIALMNAISREVPRMADAGAKAVIRLMNGIADSIRRNKNAMAAAGRNLGSAILEGMVAGIRGGIQWVAEWAGYAARAALNAAKNILGINSPSKEFMKVGVWSMEGMAGGFDDGSIIAERSAAGAANSALTAVKDALGGMGDSLSADINLDPIITPVLDLTQMSKDAARMGGMLDQKAINADMSFRQAVGISNGREPVEEAASNPIAGDTTIVELTQINNSPKALSTADIYRESKSQLAMVKEAIKRP